MSKNFYVTTAIPYVNSKPHIGNAIDYLLADIWARYQKQNGHEVRFQIGTDEHGNKIAAKAAESGMEPKAYVDSMYRNFKDLAGKIGAEYTDFVRTTDLHHMATSQYVWKKMEPWIYKDKYEGWYCQGCEGFVTDKEAQETGGICPDHNTPYERLSEENYFLRASEFTAKIREAIESKRMKIIPQKRANEFLELIKDGMQDVSISRPRKNLSWGVPVPGDDSQVMYVWADALVNYISVIGYPDDPSWKDYWPADVQVIGKDILRFHAGIWPAMLLAADIPLPKTLLAHGFVTVSGGKMSKSIGNVVDPNEVVDGYGVDAFRYFFSRHIPIKDDGDFTWEKFENAYNGELGNDLGNLISRIANMIMQYQAGVFDSSVAGEHDTAAYHEAMRNFDFGRALDEVWISIRSLNQYIERVKPWEIAKKRDSDTEATEHLAEVLSSASAAIIQIGDLLKPFLPNTADKIHAIFNNGVVTLPEDGLVIFPKVHNHTPAPTRKKDK